MKSSHRLLAAGGAVVTGLLVIGTAMAAPHTQSQVTDDEWDHPYSRRLAAFPAGLHLGPLYATGADKYWPPVGRIDGGFGDRNLVCTCPPPEAFA